MKKLALLVCALSLSGASAFAHDKGDKKMMMNMTPEQRTKMADAHEKMATCLRSDKSLKDCHQDMMKACEDTMGKDCPMHGKGMKK